MIDKAMVADRWHMLRNLGETMQGSADRHHAPIQQVAREMRSKTSLPSLKPQAEGICRVRRGLQGLRRLARAEA